MITGAVVLAGMLLSGAGPAAEVPTSRAASVNAAAVASQNSVDLVARRGFRWPDFTLREWLAIGGLGLQVAFEVVRDNPWTFGLITAAGLLLGAAAGALVFGGAGALFALLLLSGSMQFVLWLAVLGGGAALLGVGACGPPGLVAGSALGFAASVDEGELTLNF